MSGRLLPSAPTPSKPTPRVPRTLLVGTALSVHQLAHALATVQPRPTVIGCLLAGQKASGSRGAGGVSVGNPDDSDSSQWAPGSLGPSVHFSLAPPVLGGVDRLENLVHDSGCGRVDQVLVSLPMAMADTLTELAATLQRLGVRWRLMPTLSDQLAGRCAGLAGGRDMAGAPAIDPAQLIDRVPRPLDERAIRDCLTDRTVLITGAGGSIGSELASIVARFAPAMLVLVDRSENALFEIDREIARVFPELPRRSVLHDVTQRERTLDVIQRFKPHVILHAAAHKHVPMMEDHPAEAVENNFYGTRHLADAAHQCGVERLVMISSDKAVNPSSVMGATKRLAELYIRRLDTQSDTVFSMVRFGNVLGSACSVLPIWSRQLAQGGPITVTHRDMTRYFMTIPEAAGLVLQAGALSRGGEVFLLDMGRPIRILDLARRFVRLQGFEPNVDIQIALTGIRPGEKLFEVLAYDSEDMTPTDHASIRTWSTAPPDAASMRQIVRTFDRLRGKAPPWRSVSRESILAALRRAVPEMTTAAAG